MTPEQQEAQSTLEQAVTDHVRAFRPVADDQPEMATDWIVVACVTSFADQGNGDRLTAYHMAFSNGEMDEHRAIGLCRVAESLVVSGERQE